MFRFVLVVLTLCLFPVIANAQVDSQTHVYTGAGLIVTGGAIAAPLSIYLLVGGTGANGGAAPVAGGAAPGVVVAGVGVVALVAGVIEVVTGFNQRERARAERIAFTGDGLIVRW